MVTPRECRKIDINVGSFSFRLPHIHLRLAARVLWTFFGSLPVRYLMVKTLCRWLLPTFFCRFSFSILLHSKYQWWFASHIFFLCIIWSMLFYFSLPFKFTRCFQLFFLARKIAAIFLRSPIFRKNFTEFSSDALPCRVHPTHYLITISTTAKFIVDILSSCWCCLHVALCHHVSQRTSQNMK